ncbi:DUF317 domain-containing protein [Streptomyces libani]|uniref:DUF317 domain-containing protein n=1 Tax=Streptomyces nigrescens TaxID=1920 RepID=UPI00302D4EB3
MNVHTSTGRSLPRPFPKHLDQHNPPRLRWPRSPVGAVRLAPGSRARQGPSAARGELWRINVKGADGTTAWHQGFGPDTPAQAVAGFLAALISSRSRYYDCIWHIGLQAPAAVLETGRQVWEASAMAAIGGVPPHLDCFPGSPSLHLLSCCRADGWLPSSHRPGSKWKPLPLVLASPQAL